MHRRQTALGLTGYFFIGTASILVPTVMPAITNDYVTIGLSLAVIGLLFPSRAVGGILGNLLAGVGSDWLGRSRLVWMSALLVASSLAVTAGLTVWFLFLLGFVLVSVAQASLSTGINAMIADANPTNRARALNALHGVYGLGAALSPLLIGYLLGRGVPWRWALSGTGLLWLVYALVAYRVDRQDGPGREDEPTKKLDWGMLRERVFLGLFLVAFIYNGVAYSLLGWIALFMQRSAGFSVFLSASTISVFYAALTAGRFGCATFSERMGYGTTLMVLAAGLALTYPLVVFGNQPLVVVVGVFFTGLSLSGLFPTALAYGSRRWPQQTGAMTGVLNVAMTLGAMAPPLWTGTIADAWNFQGALGVNYGLVMLLLVVVLYLGRVEERV